MSNHLTKNSALAKINTTSRSDNNYERSKDLAKLLPLWPKELADETMKGTETIIKKIRQAIRLERKNGRLGHWSYNLNRHVALINALKEETKHLLSLKRVQNDITHNRSP